VSPAGRRPGTSRTREEILDAGRAEFAAAGYTAASLRAVARRAGVDPALVYHYFTSKAGLFVACLGLPADPRAVQEAARQGPPDGARIVERFLAQWEEGQAEPGRPFVTLTQAVSTSPEVARALREFLTERVWANLPRAGEEATLRTAALVSSQLLGLAWARYVVRMEPLASAPRAAVAAWTGPTLDRYITARDPDLPLANTPHQNEPPHTR
jgi:AcrR family transcriptional regulator